MIPIITVDEAKDHLRITGARFDNDVMQKTLEASAIVWKYLKIDFEASPVVFPWTGEMPFDVEAATKLILGDLWFFREGSQTGGFAHRDPISPAVVSLLTGWRDPSMA